MVAIDHCCLSVLTVALKTWSSPLSTGLLSPCCELCAKVDRCPSGTSRKRLWRLLSRPSITLKNASWKRGTPIWTSEPSSIFNTSFTYFLYSEVLTKLLVQKEMEFGRDLAGDVEEISTLWQRWSFVGWLYRTLMKAFRPDQNSLTFGTLPKDTSHSPAGEFQASRSAVLNRLEHDKPL